MAGLTRRYYSLSGGLNTTQGVGTINQGTRNTESPSTFNVEPYKLSGLKSMEGNSQLGPSLPSTITLGFEYILDSNKYLIICTDDGTVYTYNKIYNTYDKIYKFNTPTSRHSACNFNQGVIITNGVDDLVYYQYNRNYQLQGSVTLNNDSNIITGEGTSFTTQLGVGDYISFDNIEGTYRVASISSDTSLTLSSSVSIPEETQKYYAWNLDGQTYYTTTTEITDNTVVYSITGDNPIQTSLVGSITSNGLNITTSTVETITKTAIDYYCMSYTSSIGDFFAQPQNNTPSPLVMINGTGSFYFPKNVTIGTNAMGYWQQTQGWRGFYTTNSSSNLTTPYIVVDGGTAAQASNPFVVSSMNGEVPSVVQLNGRGNIYPYTFNLSRNSANDITHTYTTQETVTTTKTYTRDESSDKDIIIPTTGVYYFMTPISELNAVYINSDDETVNYPIRGLSINSYQGRIFVGANDGNLYYSELGLIHGWDVKYGAGAIPPFYNDNSDFTGLGVYGDLLVIHKRWYSYTLDGTGAEGTWSVKPYADISCDSQQSWVVANNSYFIFSKKNGGIYPLLSRTAFINNYLGKEISIKIRESFKDLNNSITDYIFPVYHPTKKYLMFYMPMLQGKGSNYCYVYDFISQAWWCRIVPQDVTIAFRYNDKIYIGTRDGKILEEFKGLTFNGEAIEFSWKSPWFDFGDGSNYLSIREFRCKISEEFTNNFYVRNRRDGYDDFKERNINNNKNAFQALEWSDESGEITDTVWDEYEWVETGFLIRRFPLPDVFFTTEQIEFYGKVKNEAMCLLGFELDRVELEEVTW